MHDRGSCGGEVNTYLATVAKRLGGTRAWLVDVHEFHKLLSSIQAIRIRVLGGIPVRVADIRGLAGSLAMDTALIADITSCGTHGCAACRLGADLSFACLGQGACLVVTARTLERKLPQLTECLATMAPLPDATALGIVAADADCSSWWHRASDAASVLAHYLRCHPAVFELRYPGLKDDPSFALAARTLIGGFGATVSYSCVANPKAWESVRASIHDPRAQVLALEQRLKNSFSL